ncbi:protein of unknown function [Methylocaldum szegediense]|uniref:Uncharacterized protein n=1 Tax=Methylocaldum szegediense TaxID=73780 RepID=A0ABM9I4I1_9GAMM|nr:protein of unknown function [Methylocaldum szegediense]
MAVSREPSAPMVRSVSMILVTTAIPPRAAQIVPVYVKPSKGNADIRVQWLLAIAPDVASVRESWISSMTLRANGSPATVGLPRQAQTPGDIQRFSVFRRGNAAG